MKLTVPVPVTIGPMYFFVNQLHKSFDSVDFKQYYNKNPRICQTALVDIQC